MSQERLDAIKAELEYLEMELKKKQYKGEKIELEGIFTLEETEPTEIEDETLFDTFGHSISVPFLIILLQTFFMAMNIKKIHAI